MAQWSHADRTLHAKVVYYGPAFGGKTTNLESLHRITDPHGAHELLSLNTSNDRTLFFDLLPFELGDILGYQVAIKLYTVPGQVRYDTTRQVVLSGADAIVFVADSCLSRREHNVWSLQNLQMNMRAKGLDPQRVPVVFQFNKQDAPDAAPPETVASWLGVAPGGGLASVAVEGRGVLETFMVASRAMIEKVVSAADARTRRHIDSDELAAQIERAFVPFVARAGSVGPLPHGAPPEDYPDTQSSLHGDALLERSVQTSVELGEKLASESARASRLERESAAYRRLCDALRFVGASFDHDDIVDTALEAIAEVVDAPVVSLVAFDGSGEPYLEYAYGRDFEPLLQFDEGRALLRHASELKSPTVVEEFCDEFRDAGAAVHVAGLRGAAVVHVENGRRIVAYTAQPGGVLRDSDLRFVTTVARHLSIGIEKARLHGELAGHRDRLEVEVGERTTELRAAYENLRRLDQVKDRFLNNISHEMKTPLTAILSAAHVLSEYDSSADERRDMARAILGSAEALRRQLDDVLRLANLQRAARWIDPVPVAPRDLVERAIRDSGHDGIRFCIEGLPEAVRCDPAGMSRAVANLIDNAVKFSPPGSSVELIATACESGESAATDTMEIRVVDRGPGVCEADRERIFEPFEQGRDPLTDKPTGMGIGLYEARRMAVLHGGTVDYRPRENGGSEFRLSVPLEFCEDAATLEESLA